jgi:RNA polymerase sigma factor (sigma-70 family)
MEQDNFSEDRKLWKRLINDERDAFSMLFRKYYKPLLNYGFHLIPRDDLVKDSIQELFFTIWDKKENLSDIENVRSYLYCSMRRSLFRQAEKQETRKERDRTYSEEDPNTGQLNMEQYLIIEEIHQEKKENLQTAFEDLNYYQKQAAFLKFYNGLSNDEISEVMGIKKKSVYNYIYRAISVLRENMKISVTG